MSLFLKRALETPHAQGHSEKKNISQCSATSRSEVTTAVTQGGLITARPSQWQTLMSSILCWFCVCVQHSGVSRSCRWSARPSRSQDPCRQSLRRQCGNARLRLRRWCWALKLEGAGNICLIRKEHEHTQAKREATRLQTARDYFLGAWVSCHIVKAPGSIIGLLKVSASLLGFSLALVPS